MRQNGTIERKHPCLLERGSRNYYLLLFHPLLSCLSFLAFSLTSRFSWDIVFFFRRASFLFSILSLSLSSAPSLSSPFFRRHDRVSVPAMLRVQQFRIGKKKKRKKAREHGLFLPILIRLPHLGTSVHPRFSVLLVPAKMRKSVFLFNYR